MKTKDQEEKENNLGHAKHNEEQIRGHEDLYKTETVVKVEDILNFCENNPKKILISGRAGIGKTTFCQYVAYQWARRKMWEQYQLVVLIPLRMLTEKNYPQKTYSRIDLIENEYYRGAKLSEEDKKFFEEQCERDQVLWLLDGYDELNVPQYLKDLILELIDRQSHILTSRPCDFDLSYDVKMDIIGFIDDNIPKYVDQFFRKKETTPNTTSSEGTALQSFLRSNPRIWGVAHIPVNLELICSLWGDTNWTQTPTLTISKLYDDMVQSLCRRYLRKQGEEPKLLNKKTKENVFKSCQKELRFLETLAFDATKAGIVIIPPGVLQNALNKIEYSPEKDRNLLNIGILKSTDYKLTGSHAEVDKDYYFHHLSFQEYFAARYLFKALNNYKKTKMSKEESIEFIKGNKYDHRFLLVLTFVFGLLIENENEDLIKTFLEAILKEPLDLIGLKHVQLVMSCMEEASEKKNFPHRVELIDLITEWIKHVVTEARNGLFIYNQFRYALQRNPSLLSEPRLISTLQNLFDGNNNLWKINILSFITETPIFNPSDEFIHLLLTAIDNYDDRISDPAVKALEKMGEKAAKDHVISKLVPLYESLSWRIRRDVCKILGNMGEKAANDDEINMLTTAVKDARSDVRESACEALGKICEKDIRKDVIMVLIRAVKDEECNVRVSACEALGKICKKDIRKDVIMVLIRAVEDMSTRVNECACKILRKLAEIDEETIRNEVMSNLMNLVEKKDGLLLWFAYFVVDNISNNKIEDSVINELGILVENREESVRRIACLTLGKIGAKATSDNIIEKLVIAIKDLSCKVKASACQAIGEMGEIAAKGGVIEALLTAVGDEEAKVREDACEALGKMGEKAAENDVVNKLLTAVSDQESCVRKEACKALGKIGEKAAKDYVINKLLTAVSDKELRVRESACEALGKMGKKVPISDLIKAFVTAVKDNNEVTSRKAYMVPGMICKEAVEDDNAIEILSNLIEDPSYIVRASASEILGNMGEKAAKKDVINKLLKAVSDEEAWVRMKACEALENMGEKAANDDVIERLRMALENEKQSALVNILNRLVVIVKDNRHRHYSFNMGAWGASGRMHEEAENYEEIKQLLRKIIHKARDVDWSLWRTLMFLDDSTYIRDNIFRTLIRTFEANVEDGASWIEMLRMADKDQSCMVKVSACKALKKMSEKVEKANVIETLWVTIQNDDYEKVKQYAFEVLENLGKSSNAVIRNKVIEKLMIAIDNEQEYVKGYAYKILTELGTVAATSAVIEKLINDIRNKSDYDKIEACNALVKMGKNAARDDVISKLISMTIGDDCTVSVSSYEALKRITEIVCSTVKQDHGLLENEDMVKHGKFVFLCNLMKYLYTNVHSELYTDRDCLDLLKILPINHLNNTLVDTESTVWIPTLAVAMLFQGYAVTLVGESLVAFSSKGQVKFDVKNEMREYLTNVFTDLRSKFHLPSQYCHSTRHERDQSFLVPVLAKRKNWSRSRFRRKKKCGPGPGPGE
jgi:HEAT repeat protein